MFNALRMFFLGYMNILKNISRMLMVNVYTYMNFRALKCITSTSLNSFFLLLCFYSLDVRWKKECPAHALLRSVQIQVVR